MQINTTNESARLQPGADTANDTLSEHGSGIRDCAKAQAKPTIYATACKMLTIWLYNIGAATLDETQARFDQHPAWRAS